jgi:hypothetical protein
MDPRSFRLFVMGWLVSSAIGLGAMGAAFIICQYRRDFVGEADCAASARALEQSEKALIGTLAAATVAAAAWLSLNKPPPP